MGSVAVVQVAVADAFQSACLLKRDAEVAGDGQGLGVVVAGLLAGFGPGEQLAEVVEHVGLLAPLAEVAIQAEGLLMAGFGSRVIAG